MAVAAQKHGLLPISQHALKFYGHLAYHGYEGIALDLDERERLVRDLGPASGDDPGQSRAALRGAHDPGGVEQHLLPGAGVPGAGGGVVRRAPS